MSLILDGTNGLSDVDGSAATPAIRGSDANTGVFFGADQVGIATNGVERVEFGNSETVFNDGGADVDFRVEGDTDANLLFVDASADKVGIGTSSPNRLLSLFATQPVFQITNVASGNTQGTIQYQASGSTDFILDNQGSGSGGVIAFMQAGTERARIDASGNLLIGATSPVASERLNVTRGGSALRVIHVENTRNVSGDEVYRSKLGSNCDNTSSYHFIATTGANDRLYMYGNGNIQNANGSYGTLSDIKLKENIVDATPKLDKLMQVRVVNYNLKTDPELKQIGVVAQELEQVFPGLVDEHADKDAEGNDLGTTTKSVKTSVFVPMLIKGLQELKGINDAQAQIITALTARVEALEGAQA
jgi:hypothetical protein